MTRRSISRRTALLLPGAVALTGCSAVRGRDEQSASERAYSAGDGSVQTVPPEERDDPVRVAGRTVEGDPVDTADWRGDVVVLNLWYAACGPCREEADDLSAVATDAEALGVRFLGINTRDGAAEAAAFQRNFAVPYPSILDTDGAAVLALRGQMVPNAVPTTLVLDRVGRVAARITGVADRSVLGTLVDETSSEADLP